MIKKIFIVTENCELDFSNTVIISATGWKLWLIKKLLTNRPTTGQRNSPHWFEPVTGRNGNSVRGLNY